MQQDDYSADKSGRYVPDAMQGQQFSISNTDANAPVSLSGVQQPQMNLFGTENTTQPPPYRAAHPSPLPSMTPTFSQHIQPQYTENPLQSQFSYRTPQSSYQSQSYNVGVSPGQIQTVFDSQLSNPIALSPGSQMSVPQGMRAVSPSQPAIPRKSIAGMMSPIRAQGQPMPPPTSPAALLASRMQGPMSPLSVYMSTAQSPQRRSQPVVLHAQNMVSGQYLPSSPVYQHPSAYSYSPQQVQTCQFSPQSSPVATSPRYVDPTQHKQMSPLLATHAQLHSPQSTHPGIVQVPRSPFKAARQLSMGVSPNKVQPVNTQWHQHPQSTRTTSQEMWENVSAPVLPSLPVLSADTLDLLSTLTVSTVSAPVQSSTISTVSDTHVQQSPLLQKHLLMPVKPIVPPTNSNLLVVSDSGKTATTSLTGTSSSQPKPYKVEAPPSRSNLKHSDRPTLLIKRSTEENLINSDKNIVSLVTTTCTDSSASTFSSSNIVTSSVHKENIDISPVDLPSTDPVSSIVMENKSNMAASAVGTTVSQSVSVSVMPLSTVPKNVLVDDKHSRNSLTSASASPLPQVPQDILEKRAKLCEIHKAKLKEKLELYKECLTELFFLQNGGNCMDFIQFKKRPSAKLLEYLKKMMPDGPHVRRKSRKISQESTVSNNSEIAPTSPASTLSNASSRKISSDDGKKVKLKLPENGADNVLKSVQLPGNERSISRKRSTSQDKTIVSSPAVVTVTKSVMSTQVHGNQISTSKGQSSPLRLKRLSRQNASTPLDESIGSQEEILERAKQEAVIQRKVVELRKQGLWTQRRLPKVQEPPRNKTHWDYLLEEMRWLAADFAQERKWKRAAARKLVRTVAAYHKEQHDKVRRAEKEEQNRLRRIASTMAREIRTFWGSIGKVVEYKQRSLLDEKRQKALDLHLSYIVDQTEKYSDWLSQGLNKTSAGSSPRSLTSSKPGSDDEFLPQGESSDDEETIAVAEEELEKIDDTEDELSLLKKESELPFNELLSSLPAEVIENIGKPLEESVDEKSDAVEGEDYNKGESSQIKTEEPTESEKEAEGSDGEDSTSSKPTPISLRRSARKRKVDSTNASKKDEADPSKRQRIEHESQGGDEEFSVDQESGEDDEATVEEEEKSGEVDHKKEIEDLQAEGEMPIEELMKLYGAAFDQDPDGEEEKQQSEDEEEVDESEDDKDVQMEKEESETEASDEDIEDDKQDEEEIGMDYLFKADLTKDDNIPMIVPSDTSAQKDDKKPEGESSPSKEITDVAAEAASLQPTGFTLATTQVVTPIPVLLKHTLREYQHIGLDWLVTMYDKRLNGILADEMGLGKTIQTIALLAHLACEKGVWGPHLIVVPTSVMLNWEMEFKKWCPGFKILTYYGSQKERKAKRTGWTKSNAFHVCITSYKLVLQDNVSFRRKKWKYLVLDEAQNIKNFKSQRWQTLLNFNSQRRLLLTGTPLQNNLMELWSLMHFLMPHVFQSHKEFKEWFSNPLTGMIEGSQEYNEKLVRRLHKVLRPFLLRRIKKDVEKQMPNKYEHVVRCHLSKRQRFLYEDFMSRASTKDTLDSGHFMSVINILMQLRKVCNHPNLFEPRSIVSPFTFDRIVFYAPSLATKVFEKSPFETLNLEDYHLHLPSLTNIHQYNAERMRELKTPRKLIEELTTDCVQGESEKPQRSKSQVIREQLSQLLKEREKLKNSTVVLNQQTGSTLPVLTIPISSSGGTTIFPSRVITIPQSNSEDAAGTKTSSTQSITLQYQTPQGTRVTIPNKQIRQLPGGVVQIMTSGSTKSVSGQTVPTQGALRVPANSRGLQNGSSDIEKGQLMEIDEQRKDGDLKQASENEFLELKDPTTYADRLHQILIEERRQRCIKMANVNEKKCEANPDWLPRGTIDYLKDIFKLPYMQSRNTIRLKSDVMDEFIKSNSTVLKEIKPVTDRFVFAISKALAKRIDFHVSHPSPSLRLKEMTGLENLEFYLKKEVQPFHRIHQATKIQFPEARLIQYDCGKLQILDVLLRRFWTEKHKCLIFTQMTKVLDILEAFLSYHGYRYLRLDGSTKVEQRMLLMERFNNDPRIFCFILSTRSGGIGVNLTGADTVIFYDSDWNPTMDAQAQDRCHRIGQTRDVHIYRLISERTVEENILKKANQKRLLGDLAIEGGSFTTAFFKEQAIKDLFNEPSGLEDLPSALVKDEKQTTEKPPLQVLARPITARQKAIAAAKEAEAKAGIDVNEKESSIEKPVSQSQDPNVQASSWEDALQQTEDKEDVDAAKQLKEEQDADMEEFTENAEGEEGEVSRVQEEMKSLYEELTPVEKYALRYLEETTEEMNKEELELAEEQVHRSKQDWEITHLMALKEEEERRLEEEEDEIFYTRDDAENQVNEGTGKKGGKKRRRKKERDICFLDMSSTSEEEDNDGIDVETLENEDELYEDIRSQEEREVNISPKKNKNMQRKKKVKTPPKKKSSAKPKDGKNRGASTKKGGKRSLHSPLLTSPKRRRASELALDIATHGYYQNDEYYFYNDDEDDSVCGEEPPWDQEEVDNESGKEFAWSDREDWPDTPSEDYSSDDEVPDDRTVFIVTDEDDEAAKHGVGSAYRTSPLWDTSNYGQFSAFGGRGQPKKPLYNIVVETSATPKKSIPKPVARPRMTTDAITRDVNRTINFNAQSKNVQPNLTNLVPTISLKPRAALPATRLIKPVFSAPRLVSNIRQVQVVASRAPAPNVKALTIFEQQAAQRQKLQSYKIPLVSGVRAPARVVTSQSVRPVFSQGQTFQLAATPSRGTATIIPLSQLGNATLNLTPIMQARAPTPHVRRVFTISNPATVAQQRKTTPSVIVPITALQQQTYIIRQSNSSSPVQIITNSSTNVTNVQTVMQQLSGHGNVLRTNTVSNVQTVNAQKSKRKPPAKSNSVHVTPSSRTWPKSPKKSVAQIKKKPEIDRGIFDIVNSVEFMSPPLQDPDKSSGADRNEEKGSLFDSLEQEFIKSDTACDLTIGSGDEDDMITLDLEPVSPSDPQLLDPNDTYENEEERNVFESFQSLLQQ